MNLHEFELRYRAYKGLNHKFDIGWDNETILQLTKISNQGVVDKALPEISPTELKEITIQTYTKFKKEYLGEKGDQKIDGGTLREYIDRLEYELKVIKEMGFNSYFLIVADFVRRAKKNQIVVGPGRGSGAGSLLARVIRITEVDPIPFGLLFERFLNPARISMPDFDIDFEDTLREQVISYVREKYGEENVASIGTYMQMAPKAAFKDVARVMGIPFEKSNLISSLMPDKMSMLDAVKSQDSPEELKVIYDSDEKVQKTTEVAASLEGNMRQLGVHACGVIIAPEKITTYSPVQYVKEDTHDIVCQYDGPTLETIGLLKMDFLGLRNLSVIKNCIKIISKKAEKEGKELEPMFSYFMKNMSFLPPIDDVDTFKKVFQVGDTTGIFQFESEGMRTFLVKLEADRIDDLVAMNALYRPGPMEFIPNYIARKKGEEPISYMHSELRSELIKKYSEEIAEAENQKLIEDLGPIMDLTYGIAVYQEQLMFLVQAMAGFSLAEADILRRGVGKKKKEVIEQLKKEFVKRCEEYREYKRETSQYIYEKMIEPAASYSFNKSHSVCYAMIAYQTAYLKAHYPVEFYAALIRSVEEDTDGLSGYINEAQVHGINVLSPNINNSFNHVAAINNEVRLGFFCIKGLGLEIGETIQKERQTNGKFQSLEDFLKRCQSVVNKKSLEGLVKSGALDEFGDRKTMLESVEMLLQWTKSSQQMGGGLFGMTDIQTKITYKNNYETTFMEKLLMDQDVFKTFVTGNPLDGLYYYIKKFSFISQFKGKEKITGTFIIIGYIKNIQRAKKKGFFVEIEDISGKIEIFMKDTVDLKKNDIVIVHIFKGRSISLEKIVRTSREMLIQQAGSKYNPEITVIKAKLLRQEGSSSNEKPKLEPIIIVKEQKKESESSNNLYPIPDNIQKIHKLSDIIKSNPGDQKIIIGNKEILVSENGVKQISSLYL
ncbi:MAG: DNA polymerase III subunit alpha [Candidatus Absconditabacteria bacterium]|nr:DNA polymerase III subunit alpha [Candidatus Absconditabacteria bacterium]